MSERLQPGDVAPAFTLPDADGNEVSLADHKGRKVIVYFYPAALTPGCTAQACHFRDLAAEFAAVGACPVGISGDAVERQQEFAGRHGLGMPLLSDADGAVRERFGVKRGFSLAPTKRTTFVIAQDRTVLDVVRSELRMNAHADRALTALRAHRA